LTNRIVILPGGNALNTAVALCRLGEAVSFWGSLGDDALGDLILMQLTKLGLDLRRVKREPAGLTPATIILRIQGEDRRFIHALGAGDRFTGEQVPWELIPENGIVVAAGYLKLRSWSDNALVEMFRETRQRQSTTVLNVCLPNHQNDIAGRCLRLLPHVDVFVLNEDEALALTGQSEVRAQARILRSAGARIVIITRGSHGLYAETGTCTFEMGAFRVPIVDPSGCGDCFTAGLVFGLLRRWELERTLQFASAVGALNATALGCTTGVPPFTEVERFLGKRCSEIAQELITA
jgi:sugar/nucleoside kinase (ribokinase family)